jgi:uncharacterized protein (DUF1697 family)
MKYIAFLRGINVGNIRIKMTDLKSAFETMGYQEVTTYLQTGNVVFTTNESIEEIKPKLEKGLSTTFHYDAYVLLYEFEVLTNIIAQYPFEKDDTHHAYVIFVENSSFMDLLMALGKEVGEEASRIALGNGVMYWKVKIGDTLGTPFAKILSKAKFKSVVTTRNINTLEKML